MALGSTQPLVKMSTRNIPGGKGDRCVGLTTSPPSRAECHEMWEPKPPGTLWAIPGLLWDCFTFNIWFVMPDHVLLLLNVQFLLSDLPSAAIGAVFFQKSYLYS
jgi:hypothetical protein